MSTTGDNLIADINDWITNYAPKAFHDLRLNNILLRLAAWIDSGGTAGIPGSNYGTLTVTQANFTTATNCPLPALNGLTIVIFWNDIPRYLVQGVDWTPYVGGGFTMLTPGFDATANAYTFFITLSA